MTSVLDVILNGKIPVRKYVLVSQPSRWNKRGDRVVVQSPMIHIADTDFYVPVRRFHGEEKNVVCFIPKSDIEKDSSNIYDKLRVSKAISWIDGHGVAIVTSSRSDELGYRQGDRFWISIGASTAEYKTKVPVINLRSFECGVICIQHVCWYPKFCGPSQEIWTLGGATRKLKLCGPNKFSHWSWAICHSLNSTEAYTKNVEIPAEAPEQLKSEAWTISGQDDSTDMATQRVNVTNPFHLTNTERRRLFARLCQNMLGKSQQSAVVQVDVKRTISIPDDQHKNSMATLPSPPISPQIIKIWPQKETQGSMHPTSPLSSSSHHIDSWKRIFDMVDRSKAPPKLRRSREGLIHSLESPSPSSHRKRARIALNKGGSSNNEDRIIAKPSKLNTHVSSASSSSHKLGMPWFHDHIASLDGVEVYVSSVLVEMRRSLHEQDAPEDSQNLTINVTNPLIFSNPTIISEMWKNAPLRKSDLAPYRGFGAEICDLGDPNCTYSTLRPNVWSIARHHYHSPPSACTISEAHEHCVSSARAAPGILGDCILAKIPSRNHTCCVWRPEDTEALPPLIPRAVPKRLKELRGKTFDFSRRLETPMLRSGEFLVGHAWLEALVENMSRVEAVVMDT